MEAPKRVMQHVEPVPETDTDPNQAPEARLQPTGDDQTVEATHASGNQSQGEQQPAKEIHEAVETNSVGESTPRTTARGNDAATRYSLDQDPAHTADLDRRGRTEVENENENTSLQNTGKGHPEHHKQAHARGAPPHLVEMKEESSVSWRTFPNIPNIPNVLTNMATSFGRSRADRPADQTISVYQYEKLWQQADELHLMNVDKRERLKEAESEIARLTNSLRKVRNECNKEKKEMMQDMQREAAERAAKLERQKKELSNKVFDLSGGIEYASHDQLKTMLEGWRGGVLNLVPNYFTEVDFDKAQHQKIFQNSDDHGFHVLKKYGGKVFWDLCESWLSNSLLDRTQSYFCIGADEAVGQSGLKVDQTLLKLEEFVVESAVATDAKSILETWRSYTVRMLLSLIGIDLRLLADYSSKDELIRKSPALERAITTIVSQVMEDTNRYILPRFNPDGSQKQKSENQVKKHQQKLAEIVSCAVVLWLNMRLSLHKLIFMVPTYGEDVDYRWMECRGGRSQMDSEGPPKVLFVVSPAVVKRNGTRVECIVKADVFPA